MLRWVREFGLPGPGVSSRYTGVHVPGVRAYVTRTTNVSFDIGRVRALPSLGGRSGWLEQFSIPLDGELTVRRDGREISVPVGTGAFDAGGPWDERWDGARFGVLVLEWARPAGTARFEPGPLARRDVQRLAEQAAMLEGGASPPSGATVDRMVDLLRALGIPIPPAMTFQQPVPRGAQAVVDALCQFESRRILGWVELEQALGLSERQLRRNFERLSPWLGPLPYGSELRRATRYTRLKRACMLLGSRNVQIADVATAVGYGSTRALDLAFAQAGLPAPSDLRRGS